MYWLILLKITSNLLVSPLILQVLRHKDLYQSLHNILKGIPASRILQPQKEGRIVL